MFKFGYKVGRESIQSLLGSGMINKVITGSSILGLIMMGALSASYVKLSIPIKIKLSNANPIRHPRIIRPNSSGNAAATGNCGHLSIFHEEGTKLQLSNRSDYCGITSRIANWFILKSCRLWA